MFTVLWKIDRDNEQLYSTYGVALIPPTDRAPCDDWDCSGRRHVAFQALTAVQDSDNLMLNRTVIDVGEVFVMNGDGKTIAIYRFDSVEKLRNAA